MSGSEAWWRSRNHGAGISGRGSPRRHCAERGIGRAFVHALADAGAAVVVNDLELEPAEAVAAEIRTAGRQAGDRLALWSHPAEIRDRAMPGGWSTEAIAKAWPELTDGAIQPFGAPTDFDL